MRVARGQEIILPPTASERGAAAEPWRVRRVVRAATESYDAAESSPRAVIDARMRGRLIDILV